MTGKFEADYVGIGEMLNAEFMQAEMLRRAELGKGFAEAVAPVDADDDHPGRYKASFSVSSGAHGGPRHDRAYGRLENDSPEAEFVEYGSANNDAHHVLSRALDIMGA